MSTKTLKLENLKDEFPLEDIEWRIQSSGKTSSGKLWALIIPYISNRAIQDRLDEVVGLSNWGNVYREWQGKSVLCGISIRIKREGKKGAPESTTDEYEWVTKYDGADNTDIEATKGGLSGAMKRAAVQWGIGRYLYTWDAQFAKIHPDGKNRAKIKDGEKFQWDPPSNPHDKSGKPAGNGKSQPEQRNASNGAGKPSNGQDKPLPDPDRPCTPQQTDCIIRNLKGAGAENGQILGIVTTFLKYDVKKLADLTAGAAGMCIQHLQNQRTVKEILDEMAQVQPDPEDTPEGAPKTGGPEQSNSTDYPEADAYPNNDDLPF